jgi:Rrf2 family nitric oxide-sensitive transcriptional repressor
MKLTAFTDYTLRTLIYLALHGERQATIADIARTYRVSEAHLTKVVHRLGVAGDIETVRGKGGGLRLKRAPAQINLGALVRRTEPDLDLVPCFEDAETCMIARACVLQAALHEALAAFLAVLDRYTLADLIAPRQDLAALLHLDVAAEA